MALKPLRDNSGNHWRIVEQLENPPRQFPPAD